MIDLAKYIKLCCVIRDDMPSAELARRSGISPQNLNGKSNNNKFSNIDLEKIAEALDARLEIRFIGNDTGEPLI